MTQGYIQSVASEPHDGAGSSFKGKKDYKDKRHFDMDDDDMPDIPLRDFYDYRLLKRPNDPRWRHVCGVMGMKFALLRKYEEREQDPDSPTTLLEEYAGIIPFYAFHGTLWPFAFLFHYIQSFAYMKRDSGAGRYRLR